MNIEPHIAAKAAFGELTLREVLRLIRDSGGFVSVYLNLKYFVPGGLQGQHTGTYSFWKIEDNSLSLWPDEPSGYSHPDHKFDLDSKVKIKENSVEFRHRNSIQFGSEQDVTLKFIEEKFVKIADILFNTED
jgi:hypothetical protein